MRDANLRVTPEPVERSWDLSVFLLVVAIVAVVGTLLAKPTSREDVEIVALFYLVLGIIAAFGIVVRVGEGR